MHTLGFIQSVCYIIPFHDLTKEKTLENTENDEGSGDTALAVRWITEQVERFEVEGPDVEVDYEKELTDNDEELILRSSTTGFAEFVSSFLGRVFILLQNLPDASRVKSGSPEENVVNTLPATFTPLLAALSPELYELALGKISQFVTNHVVHQARDAMAFICNAVVKINPKVALARLLPDLIGNIRTEIDENGAGSTRTTGAEILPRDRALVWHISLLSMCVVHVGSEVLDYRKELFEIATHMQDKCKGIPLVHVSNFIHHLLLNLTVTYTTDYTIYEKEELKRGLTAQDWGKITKPKDLTIEWHTPSREEIDFAIELFESQAERAIAALTALTGENSPINRDGTGKDWSDEVSRNLTLLRLVISGISRLFYSDDTTITPRTHRDIAMNGTAHGTGITREESSSNEDDSDEADLGESDDKQIRISFQYPTGYPLEVGSAQYELVHRIRRSAGEILHHVHEFLVAKQEDDVPCFSALYTAYRSWFVDVGIERSAHVLDRLTRLLHADTHPYKFSGLRKEYPRPLLVRRANVYHCQRLRHNESPRVMSDLDKKLLLDLAHSSVSVYIDIRRTAQSA
ncbi:Proteasome activator BLM10, partial [Cryomyces antarcticus]